LIGCPANRYGTHTSSIADSPAAGKREGRESRTASR
jgi:hypothetical protein